MGSHPVMLGIPLSAFIATIFGIMLVSFPLGAYMVFETDMGEQITHRLPAADMSVFGVGQYEHLPSYIEMGDMFVVAWAAYLVVFGVALTGPGRNFAAALRHTSNGKSDGSNYLLNSIIWFSILIVVSGIIEVVQGQAGLSMTPPDTGNDLVQFHLITLAPITEEAVFRVILVGLPVFALYTHRVSLTFLIKCLWHPARHLHIYDTKKMFIVIGVASVAFGTAHILSGETWGEGKVLQAAAAGAILGYAYCRHGLICAILVHWATNYFLYTYGNFVAHLGDWSLMEAFEQPFFGTVQIILLAAGILSVSAMIIERLSSRRIARVE